VYFPRLIIPIASVITPMLDFAVVFAILIPTLLWFGFTPTLAAIVLPAFVVLAIATALAAALWCAVLNVEYRDVRYVLPFALQFWMFATPIAYPASLVPQPWRVLYGLNPMASVVEGFRWALLGSPAPGPMVFVSAAAVAVALAGGVAYFRRMEGTFADVL
jgi:lipopolysaccharide transport system permease protein